MNKSVTITAIMIVAAPALPESSSDSFTPTAAFPPEPANPADKAKGATESVASWRNRFKLNPLAVDARSMKKKRDSMVSMVVLDEIACVNVFGYR